MDISLSRECNRLNLVQVAKYLGESPETLLGHYDQLLSQTAFVARLNQQMARARDQLRFDKGIFGKAAVDSVDWFAFERILLYVLVRTLKPTRILETGVYYGGNTVFLLKGLEDNGSGSLISIDLPDSKIKSVRHPGVGETELYPSHIRPGFLVPDDLAKRWQLMEGSSLEEIPKLTGAFDFYVHDSEHSFDFLQRELEMTLPKLSHLATLLVDDIDWSNAFFAFCVANQFVPLLLTDNGKDGLRVRTGLVRRAHPANSNAAFVGQRDCSAAPAPA
ncbi:MAG: class I SAM-dependent methyltransferase [Acidimicrobiia bacterium]|nr:class I SAM-dependent methyltransferase [Acidimicrobiia bacterium]